MLGKRLFENSGCNIHSFPSKFIQSNGKKNIAEDLCAVGGDPSPLTVKCPKVVSARGYTKHSGPFPSWDNHRESEGCATVENSRCSDVSENAETLSAVPLRCLLPDVQPVCDNLLAKQGESDGGEQKPNLTDKAYSGNDTWKSDLEKLTELIARAEEYIQLSNAKYSTLKEVPPTESKGFDRGCSSGSGVLHNGPPVGEPKPDVDANKKETMAGHILAEPFSRQSSEGSLSEIKMKIKDKVSKACQGKYLSTLEVKVEDDEDDENFVLSHAKWNTLQQDPTCICDNGLVDEEVADIRDEHTHFVNQTELINLSIVPHDHPQAIQVRTLLKLFEEQYVKLIAELREPSKEKCARPHLAVAARLKADGMYLSAEKPFGHIPGVHVGDEFRFRAELSVIGLHHQLIAGIDYVVLSGKKFATSVINSGRYENEAKAHDVLIYSGQGGNQKISEKAVDQKLERGNLALKNSMEMRYPVRVTYKRKSVTGSEFSGTGSESNVVYVYDGLYTVKRMWQESDQNGKLAFKFELHRRPDQPRLLVKPLRQMKMTEPCIVDDISQGKEKLSIPAVNELDDNGYPSFTYMTNMVYPTWYKRVEPIGCNCINGCSDSQQCPCVLRNGGEFPFNENGKLIRAKPMTVIHACGPSCKCPPSCMNRVSQHGPRCQLEIFNTATRGWGVRSRDNISSGSFICEYIGELLREKDAEQRIDNDEYLFDITDDKEEGGAEGEFQGFVGSKSNDDGFAIDAAKFGNIGRFINHSCSPNLFAQKVIYDDKRIPHIMLFAGRNIPPLQELSYDYNYKIGRVCDANGNIKMKDCFCGSRKCIGRMY